MRLRLVGSSLSQVARDLGVRPTTVTSVSQGLRRSRRIEGRIAEVLTTAPAQLWPEPALTRTTLRSGAALPPLIAQGSNAGIVCAWVVADDPASSSAATARPARSGRGGVRDVPCRAAAVAP